MFCKPKNPAIAALLSPSSTCDIWESHYDQGRLQDGHPARP
jgi:integrase